MTDISTLIRPTVIALVLLGGIGLVTIAQPAQARGDRGTHVETTHADPGHSEGTHADKPHTEKPEVEHPDPAGDR